MKAPAIWRHLGPANAGLLTQIGSPTTSPGMPIPSPAHPRSRFATALCLVAALVLPAILPAAAPAIIPVESFFSESEISLVRLSPDGNKLAFLTTLATGKVGIALMHLDTGKV